MLGGLAPIAAATEYRAGGAPKLARNWLIIPENQGLLPAV
jgi:hypothetical protein